MSQANVSNVRRTITSETGAGITTTKCTPSSIINIWTFHEWHPSTFTSHDPLLLERLTYNRLCVEFEAMVVLRFGGVGSNSSRRAGIESSRARLACLLGVV